MGAAEDPESLVKEREEEVKTCLTILDELDKEWSGKVHECKAHTVMEYIILIFAGMFNRGYGFSSFATSYLYATIYPEYLNRFLQNDAATPANLGAIYVIFYFIVSFFGIVTSLIGKKIIKRKRPIYATVDFLKAPELSPLRVVSMAHREIGNPAMPSADSTWGAIWCTLNVLLFQSKVSIFVLPMVMLGRVYFRCHWIGDTVIGSLIGIISAMIGFIYFPEMAQLIQSSLL